MINILKLCHYLLIRLRCFIIKIALFPTTKILFYLKYITIQNILLKRGYI